MRGDSGCSTADLATWVRCCTFSAWRATAHSLSARLFSVHQAPSQFLSHTQTTWVQQPVVLKARRNTWTSRDELLAGIWLGSHSEHIIGSGDIRYHTALMTSYSSAQQTTRQETCAIRWELWFNSTKQSLSISPCRFLYRRLFTALYKNGGFQIEFAAGVCVSFTPIGFMQGTHSHTHSH